MSTEAATLEAPEDVNLTAVQPPSSLPAPNFDDFSNIGKPAITPPDGSQAKKEETPKEAQPKAEVPPVEPPKAAEIAKGLPEFGAQPKKREPDVRGKKDFTDIDPADLPYIKEMAEKMSDLSFASYKKYYLENRTLKKQIAEAPKAGELPKSYYENPNAYLLDPKFQEISQKVEIAEEALAHWQEQYERASLDQPVSNLVIDEKGKLVYGAPQEIPANQKAKVLARIIQLTQEATNGKMTFAQQRQQLLDGFKGRHQSILNDYKQITEPFFNGWDAKEHPTKPLQEKWDKQFPASIKENPAYPTILYGRVMLELQDAMIKELRLENDKLKGVKSLADAQPPTKDEISAAPKPQSKVPSFADFESAMNKR
jgi:hypothetical protein